MYPFQPNVNLYRCRLTAWLFTKSFSHTCPVLISHSNSSRSIEGLAIIDDHATYTFANPLIIKELQIAHTEFTASALTNQKMNGIQHKEPLIIKNLLITPLNGDESILINKSRTCQLPDVQAPLHQ